MTNCTEDHNIRAASIAIANTDGYFAGAPSPYPYAPVPGYNDSTILAGTNLASNCSGPLISLCSDTAAGVGYDDVNHIVIVPDRSPLARPGSGAWDSGAYQLNAGTPAVIISITPNFGVQGATLDELVSGASTNFSAPTVASFGAGIAINMISCPDTTHCTVNITIAGNATPGVRTVTMTTGASVATASDSFIVNLPNLHGAGARIRLKIR
jgi:hypothetical protein